MEKTEEQVKKTGGGRILIKILYIVGILIIAKIIFFAGVMVGFHKASFGQAWEEHYNENFGMGRFGTPFMAGSMQRISMMNYFPNAHGATGKIIKIELPNIIVQDKDNKEKIVSIGEKTKIEEGRTGVKPTDLKVDDFVVVIGIPDTRGTIEARLVRVIPSPEFLNQ